MFHTSYVLAAAHAQGFDVYIGVSVAVHSR